MLDATMRVTDNNFVVHQVMHWTLVHTAFKTVQLLQC